MVALASNFLSAKGAETAVRNPEAMSVANLCMQIGTRCLVNRRSREMRSGMQIEKIGQSFLNFQVSVMQK